MLDHAAAVFGVPDPSLSRPSASLAADRFNQGACAKTCRPSHVCLGCLDYLDCTQCLRISQRACCTYEQRTLVPVVVSAALVLDADAEPDPDPAMRWLPIASLHKTDQSASDPFGLLSHMCSTQGTRCACAGTRAASTSQVLADSHSAEPRGSPPATPRAAGAWLRPVHDMEALPGRCARLPRTPVFSMTLVLSLTMFKPGIRPNRILRCALVLALTLNSSQASFW